MNGYHIDVATVIGYFVIILIIGVLSGRGRRRSAADYFISKKSLPWWAIGAAYVATGLNTEQLIGMNGMSYMIGLPLVNSYLIAIFVYTALIYCFFPLYLRNNIITMPQYLGERFNYKCQGVFSVLLLISYVFLGLAVVLYGGAKLFEGVYGLPVWLGVLILGIVSGIYTLYGGMSSMVNAAVFQFSLIFIAGITLFILGYLRLPNGWNDIVEHAPGGFHLVQPMDYPVMPWHAVIFSLFNLQLFYSCINQALVQRGFGARTEWDARMAIIFALAFVLLRPFLEVFPGLIARALAYTGQTEFIISEEKIDSVFPILISNLVPEGFKGLVLVGILSSVMSTISAFLNSISTLFTYDIYKNWINKKANDKKLVRVGMISTLFLMTFGILTSPIIGKFGGIFLYFQTFASYLAVPVATCFLFGMFWKRTTSMAVLAILIGGIPLGLLIHLVIIPITFSEQLIERYSLTNFYVACGITQIICAIAIVLVSFYTKPREKKEISRLMWSPKLLRLEKTGNKRPIYESIELWWVVMVLIYGTVYYFWW